MDPDELERHLNAHATLNALQQGIAIPPAADVEERIRVNTSGDGRRHSPRGRPLWTDRSASGLEGGLNMEDESPPANYQRLKDSFAQKEARDRLYQP